MRRKVVELLVILLLIGGSIAVLSLVDSADATRPVPLPLVADVSASEVQLRYEKALSILNDTTVNDVSSVPCMLESCAEAGHAQATLLLLDVYEGKRKGIEADMRKAADWANRIAIHSPNRALAAEARFRLACYEERRGTRQSLKEAFDNMRRAAEMGSPKAQAELARYLMRGIGTARNPQAAIRVLKKLAKENPEAPNLFFYAGYMYMKGLGIYGGPDYKTALFLYDKGRMLHDARATNNLGLMYERGMGVASNPAKAFHYYRIAAELGCREASTNMQRMAFRLKKSAISTWQQRLARATLRVLQALPLAPGLRKYLESPLQAAATTRS